MKSTSWSPEWKAEAVKQKTLRGWNYSQLAKAAGLGVGQVQKYMTGKYHNDNPRAMTRSSIFSCFMSFVAGGCMVALVMFCARHPTREMLLGWAAYLLLAFALAYKLGGALIL